MAHIEDQPMQSSPRLSPCLWFDTQAEEAANFYIGIFPDSRIIKVTHFTDAGFEHHQKPKGSVMTVAFELNGQPVTALNGGPAFKLSEAFSLEVICETQDEVDHYWNRLSEGGDEQAQQCGWLKDKFGLSWQIVPSIVLELVSDTDPERSERAMNAILSMKKVDIEALKLAAKG
jgi:predicted 3-demethylubiquinone-9 3-methyltransferase (glyoxalase superfamily)